MLKSVIPEGEVRKGYYDDTFHTDHIILPQTEAHFDDLIHKLAQETGLPNEFCAAVIAQRIQHFPPDHYKTSITELSGYLLKQNAYLIARKKAQEIQQNHQLEQIEAELKANPNNQEALDALHKAAHDGSPEAKLMLAGFIQEKQ